MHKMKCVSALRYNYKRSPSYEDNDRSKYQKITKVHTLFVTRVCCMIYITATYS